MRKILVVEDDRIVHKIIEGACKHDFELIPAFSLQDAKSKLEAHPDVSLIIIDRALPDGDGLSLCAQIREQEHLQTKPIIFLTAHATESDKVTGLFAGADDYIAKPFSPLELRARISARLRLSHQKLFTGQVEIDVDGFTAFARLGGDKRRIDLTPLEFKLLLVLVQNPNKVLQRQDLLNRVWGVDTNISDRVIDTHISHLRKKLQGLGVRPEAVRGEGYRLVAA